MKLFTPGVATGAKFFPFIVATISVLGCSLFTSPEPRRFLGDIAGYNANDPDIDIRVEHGSVRVRVATYGNSCTTDAGTEVSVLGSEATVSPYDEHGDCLDRVLQEITHTATINFRQPGSVRVLVRGIDRSARSASNLMGDTITVERTVTVQ